MKNKYLDTTLIDITITSRNQIIITCTQFYYLVDIGNVCLMKGVGDGGMGCGTVFNVFGKPTTCTLYLQILYSFPTLLICSDLKNVANHKLNIVLNPLPTTISYTLVKKKIGGITRLYHANLLNKNKTKISPENCMRQRLCESGSGQKFRKT